MRIARVWGLAPIAGMTRSPGPVAGRGERGRGSSRGSPDERASGPGIRLSSPPCTEAASSSADDADYADRGGITFGSTCTCGAVPEPCLPLLRGEASSANGGVPALDCRTRDPVVLVVSAAQLSAPHHAECPRSDRWILANTKSLLTQPRGLNRRSAGLPHGCTIVDAFEVGASVVCQRRQRRITSSLR